LRTPLPLLAILLALACATDRVGHDADPEAPLSSFHRFGILEARPRSEIPEDPRFGPLLDRHTEAAIERGLRARGYQLETRGDVDFLVAYAHELRFEQRTHGSPVSLGVGYGTAVSGVGLGTGWYGPARATTHRVARDTLVIDVLDPATRRLLWRGWAKDTLSRDGDPRAETFAAVSAILARFPAASPR